MSWSTADTQQEKIAQFFRNSPTATSNFRFEIRTKNYPNFSIALHREREKKTAEQSRAVDYGKNGKIAENEKSN